MTGERVYRSPRATIVSAPLGEVATALITEIADEIPVGYVLARGEQGEVTARVEEKRTKDNVIRFYVEPVTGETLDVNTSGFTGFRQIGPTVSTSGNQTVVTTIFNGNTAADGISSTKNSIDKVTQTITYDSRNTRQATVKWVIELSPVKERNNQQHVNFHYKAEGLGNVTVTPGTNKGSNFTGSSQGYTGYTTPYSNKVTVTIIGTANRTATTVSLDFKTATDIRNDGAVSDPTVGALDRVFLPQQTRLVSISSRTDSGRT